MTDTAARPTVEHPASSVPVALAKVLAEIGGVAKLTAEERRRRGMGGGDKGITYAYRGIDQIAAAAQPLLGQHGVVIVPYETTYSVDEVTVADKPWTDTTCLVTWRIYGPAGDYIEARSVGLGRDNSDKGANKASTSAFKNLLLRLLCIGDPADDTDGHTHERDARQVPDRAHRDAAVAVFERLKALAAEQSPAVEAVRRLRVERDRGLQVADLLDAAWRAEVERAIDAAESGADQHGAIGGDQPVHPMADNADAYATSRAVNGDSAAADDTRSPDGLSRPCNCGDELLALDEVEYHDTTRGLIHRADAACGLDDNPVTATGPEADDGVG